MSWNRTGSDDNNMPLLAEHESIFSTEQNVSIEYENGGGFPGSGETLAGNGTLYLTPIRIIFLPKTPTRSFSSFSCPLANIEDATYVKGWFGGSCLNATVKSIPNEGFTKEFGKLTVGVSGSGQEFKAAFDHLISKLGPNPVAYIEELPAYPGPTDNENGPPAYI